MPFGAPSTPSFADGTPNRQVVVPRYATSPRDDRIKGVELLTLVRTPKASWAKVSHVPAINSPPDLRLAAIATRKDQSAREPAKSFGADRWFPDPFAMIRDDRIDVVTIAVKVPAHRELVLYTRASCFWVYAYPAFLRFAAHSAGGYWGEDFAAGVWRSPRSFGASAFRSRVLNLAKTCSIGLRSGWASISAGRRGGLRHPGSPSAPPFLCGNRDCRGSRRRLASASARGTVRHRRGSARR